MRVRNYTHVCVVCAYVLQTCVYIVRKFIWRMGINGVCACEGMCTLVRVCMYKVYVACLCVYYKNVTEGVQISKVAPRCDCLVGRR